MTELQKSVLDFVQTKLMAEFRPLLINLVNELDSAAYTKAPSAPEVPRFRTNEFGGKGFCIPSAGQSKPKRVCTPAQKAALDAARVKSIEKARREREGKEYFAKVSSRYETQMDSESTKETDPIVQMKAAADSGKAGPVAEPDQGGNPGAAHVEQRVITADDLLVKPEVRGDKWPWLFTPTRARLLLLTAVQKPELSAVSSVPLNLMDDARKFLEEKGEVIRLTRARPEAEQIEKANLFLTKWNESYRADLLARK